MQMTSSVLAAAEGILLEDLFALLMELSQFLETFNENNESSSEIYQELLEGVQSAAYSLQCIEIWLGYIFSIIIVFVVIKFGVWLFHYLFFNSI